MKLIKYIERINLLHKLIKERRTGTPEQFSRRLRISRPRLYQLIEELRMLEVPVAYSRQIQSYYYTEEFRMEASLVLVKTKD